VWPAPSPARAVFFLTGLLLSGPGIGAAETSAAGPGLMHDEGQRWRLLDADGQPSGWSIELARLTYQETRTAVLKLGLIEDATGDTVAYSWANPEAERIGINLRWAQIGLTLKQPQPQFGF
jgi:hypothetical protein